METQNETHKHKISNYKNNFLIHNLFLDRIGFIVFASKDGYNKAEINAVLTSLNLKPITEQDKQEVKVRLIKERGTK